MGSYQCRDCECRCNGDVVVLNDKGRDAIDGSKAFRVYFVCRSHGHLNQLGYTKPVDFNLNAAEQIIDDKTFAEIEAEEEAEWKELTQTRRYR